MKTATILGSMLVLLVLLVTYGTTDTASAASDQATAVVGIEDAQTTQIDVATKLVDNEQISTLGLPQDIFCPGGSGIIFIKFGTRFFADSVCLRVLFPGPL